MKKRFRLFLLISLFEFVVMKNEAIIKTDIKIRDVLIKQATVPRFECNIKTRLAHSGQQEHYVQNMETVL